MLFGRLGRGEIAAALDRFGVIDAGLRARAAVWPRRTLTVLLYHRVTDLGALGELDPELVDATPEDFDRQMELVKRHFVPISLDAALAAASNPAGHPLPPNAILITFDDGYRDNLEIAVPILKRHGVRATFFIATGYMGSRRLFWWERISLLIRRATTARFSISYPEPYAIELGGAAARRQAARALLRTVKDHYDLDLDRFLDEIAAAAGVPWTRADDEKHAGAAILDWAGVAALKAAGMDVASHTREHRILQTLRPERLAAELAESKAELETRLGQAVRALAYPVGKRLTAFPAVRQAVRQAGYELGFVVQPGVNDFGRNGTAGNGDHLYDLKRIPVDRSWPMAQFRATLLHHAFAG
jgi:peptidoglycan/xylan/chitin deacetylase (PgdA/CDA1 family)